MKSKQSGMNIILILALTMGMLGMSTQLSAREIEDKTESPYFFVQSDDPEIDQLPLKSTHVDVSISGVMADVTVTQVYENKGSRPIEAIYIFPASIKAAVYGMKMTIGERTIIAKIKKTQEARADYEAAKAAGKTASLLEQHRPNVFQMNVANILPEDRITVELKYTELLVPTDRVYAFMYPTVVGPRYNSDPGADPAQTNPWVSNPYLQQGELSPSTLDIQISLNGGMPVKDIVCNSHKMNIDFKTADNARIQLDASEKYDGNRDFILKYRLAGNQIQTGLLLSHQEKENFFLMMIQPPKRVKTDDIPPREYVFIVDVSGSMNGFPLDISKTLLKDLIRNLRATDKFNVLMFAGASSVLSETSLPATSGNIQKAITFLEKQRGGGGTHLLPALKRAFDMSSDEEGLSRTLVVVTDGYVSVEEEAFDLIQKRLGDANLFAFGIGASVNRHLIEGMARVGYGEPFIITKPQEAQKTADSFRKLIQTPVLTDISVDYGKFDVYDLTPKTIPDVLADRPILVYGKYKGTPKGNIAVKGYTGEKTFSHKINVKSAKPEAENNGLKYLWARHQVALLSDYIKLHPTDERIETVTRLGLDYSLLTAYTSFVAVDSKVRVENGQPVTVKQPLPLPEGVSNSAVGAGRQMAYAPAGRTRGLFAPMAKQSIMVEKKYKAEEALCDEMEVQHDKEAPVVMNLKVPGGMAKAEVKKILESLAPELCKCMKDGRHQTLSLVIDLDKAGNVIEVKIFSEDSLSKAAKKCLTEKIKKQVFPAIRSGQSGRIQVQINLC